MKNNEFDWRTNMENLVGKRFDMLEVIEFVERTPHRQNIWKCKCDCGKIKNRYEQSLKDTSHYHSCGCYSKKYLIAGDSERCSKAGKQRAKVRNIDGINVDMLDNSKNISTNTSGHKGISWSNSAHKWHVFVGYKSYRCNLAYVEDFDDAIKIRDAAVQAIKDGTFEDFFYDLRGFRIEEKLQQQIKKKRN